MKSCMFLIDCQNGMLNSYNEDFVYSFNTSIKEENANRKYDYYIQSLYENNTDTPCYRDGWKNCMPNTDDYTSFVPTDFELDKTFVKSTYSSCTPEVLEFFKANNITKVYLCGISTNCCVLATAFELYDKGFEVYLIEDLCTASSKANHFAGINTFRSCFGEDKLVRVTDSSIWHKNIETIKKLMNESKDYSYCVWNNRISCNAKQPCSTCNREMLSYGVSNYNHYCSIIETDDKLWKALLNCIVIKDYEDIDRVKSVYKRLRAIQAKFYTKAFEAGERTIKHAEWLVEVMMSYYHSEDAGEETFDDTVVYDYLFNMFINTYIEGFSQEFTTSEQY